MSAVPSRVARFTPPSLFVALVVGLATLAPVGVPVVRAQGPSPIDLFLQSYVDSNRIAGAVVLVLRDGQVVYERGGRLGGQRGEAPHEARRDLPHRVGVETDHVGGDPPARRGGEACRSTIRSRGGCRLSRTRSSRATRPATAAARSSPRVGRSRFATSSRTRPGSRTGSSRRSRLDTPTKALGPGAGAGLGWYTADKDEPACTTMERLGTLPFVAQPGERWVFGYNLDILGCVVERASGTPLDRYIHDRITAPLGMKDTYFFLPPDQRARLVAVYASDSTRHALRGPEGPRGQGDYVDGPRKNFAGGAGLLSTARDYSRFLEMIRAGGTLDGVRILSSRSVDLMTHNQIGARYGVPGQGFGFGFYTIDSTGADGPKSVGTFGWRGGYGTIAFVDPKEKLTVVFMINQIPNTADLAAKLPAVVYDAVVR